MVEIKVRIKQALQMREMKQAELAEKTGIDKRQISSYISGRYKPKRRFETYAKQIYEMREPERVLKLYGELSEENRSRVLRYMEKVLAVQRMEEC